MLYKCDDYIYYGLCAMTAETQFSKKKRCFVERHNSWSLHLCIWYIVSQWSVFAPGATKCSEKGIVNMLLKLKYEICTFSFIQKMTYKLHANIPVLKNDVVITIVIISFFVYSFPHIILFRTCLPYLVMRMRGCDVIMWEVQFKAWWLIF